MHKVIDYRGGYNDRGEVEFAVVHGAQNALVAVQRYAANISTDFERQQGIDLLLGFFQPKTNRSTSLFSTSSSVTLWDIDNRPHIQRFERSRKLKQYQEGKFHSTDQQHNNKTDPIIAMNMMNLKSSTDYCMNWNPSESRVINIENNLYLGCQYLIDKPIVEYDEGNHSLMTIALLLEYGTYSVSIYDYLFMYDYSRDYQMIAQY
jgi:hypothetical protein